MKPSWASSSVVTSTTVVEKAVVGETPRSTAARAPITKPPNCEKGSNSPAESRTIRDQMKIGQRRVGSARPRTYQAEPSRKKGRNE